MCVCVCMQCCIQKMFQEELLRCTEITKCRGEGIHVSMYVCVHVCLCMYVCCMGVLACMYVLHV